MRPVIRAKFEGKAQALRLFIVFGGLLIACLLALLVGPRFVDWTGYRTAFETEASRLVGRKVEVRGAVSAQLLPFPSIAFNDVVVGEAADPILTMAAFRMDAELAPFLSGEVRIFNTELDAPRLSLPVDAGGAVRWPIAASSLPTSLPVVFEKVRIADGSVLLTDRRLDRRVRLDAIDADLSARSLLGPISGTGTLRLNDQPLRVSLSTGIAPGDGTLSLRVTAESDSPSLSVSVSGIASSVPGKPLVDGTLTLRTPLAEPSLRAVTPWPAIQLHGGFQLSTQRIALSDLRASVGEGETPYLVTGAASLNLAPIPHFDIDLSGQDIDLDQIAPTGTEAGTAPSFTDRVQAVRAALRRLPASPFPGRVRLALPIVTIGDTPIREVRFSGSPSQGGWSIDRMSGELPGRTLVEASGVAELGATPGFRGSLLLAARQPATFFNWAGLGGTASLAQLEQAGLQAKVELSAATQRFDQLELNLGGQVLRGTVNRTVRPEGVATAVELRGDAVDLEPLLALARLRPQAEGEAERTELQLSAAPLRYAGMQADSVEADVTLSGDLLDISAFDANGFAGADIHAEGTIATVSSAPVPDLSVELSADEPARFLAFLRTRLPESPLLKLVAARGTALGPLSLSGTASPITAAGRNDLVAELSGQAGGTALTVKLALENGLAAAWKDGRFGLDMVLRNDKPVDLLGQVGLPALDLGAPGPLALHLVSSGAPSEGASVSLSAEAPGSSLTLEGTAALAEAGLASLDARLALRSEEASLWLTTLGLGLGQGVDALPVDAKAQLKWFGGDWVLDEAEGHVADNRFTGQLSAAGGSGVIGKLRLDHLSADWLLTLLTGVAQEGADADTHPFAAPFLPERAFRLALEAETLEGAPGSLRDLKANVSGTATELTVSDFEAGLGEGRVEGSGRFSNVGGLVGTRWTWRLADRPVQLGGGEGAILSGLLDADMSFQAGGQSWQALRLSADGTGNASLRNAKLFGTSPDVMRPVLAAADEKGFSAKDEAVARLVGEAQTASSLDLGTVSAGLRLGNGTLQIGPAEAQASGLTLNGEARVALADRVLSGRIDIALPKPAEEDVVDAPDPALVYTLSGTLSQPRRDIGVGPLTSYLASRAYQIEQARVRTLEEALRETVRLRREVRFYEARAKERDALRDARLKSEEEARRAELERAEAARAEAARAEAARVETERRRAASEAAATPNPPSAATGTLDLEAPPVTVPQPASPSGFPNLPGVQNPTRF
ncbi:AsmA family protein [Aureimonas sp. AU40]|uniref:AsmA family protein n=1 Tax=Aureimonas sp. AU40 TaxID=1637747 RepID=UPI0009E71D25|nr:AsmA family protein [Aureimonas sp. AU40]